MSLFRSVSGMFFFPLICLPPFYTNSGTVPWFPKPEKVKLAGVDKHLYAYRVGEGSDKERVVVSNKGLSKRQFEVCYRHRWQVEEFIQLRGGDRPAYYVFT